MTHRGFEIYVSHVDIFLVFCYGNEVLCETIVRPGSHRREPSLVAQYRSHRAITISGLEPRSKSGGNHQARQLPFAHELRTFTSTEKRNGSAVRPNARGDLVRWETHPEPGRKNSRPDPRAALCERRVRGRARVRGSDFQKPGTLRASEAFRHHPGFRAPVFGRRD